MSVSYCPDCGKANQFIGTKPLYCGFCQAGLSIGATKAPKSASRAAKEKHEIEFIDEDDNSYYKNPRGSCANRSNVKITFVDQDIKEQKEPERTPVRLDEVFGGGSLGVVNNGPVARPPELKNKSYVSGDKQAFAKNFLNQQVFSSAREKPTQEVN